MRRVISIKEILVGTIVYLLISSLVAWLIVGSSTDIVTEISKGQIALTMIVIGAIILRYMESKLIYKRVATKNMKTYLGIDIIGAVVGLIILAAYLVITIITANKELISLYPVFLLVLYSVVRGLLGKVYVTPDMLIVFNQVYQINDIQSMEEKSKYSATMKYMGKVKRIDFRSQDTRNDSLTLLESYGINVVMG